MPLDSGGRTRAPVAAALCTLLAILPLMVISASSPPPPPPSSSPSSTTSLPQVNSSHQTNTSVARVNVSSTLPSRRQARVYRIRAAGANGLFGSVGSHSATAQLRVSHSPAIATTTTTTASPPFGLRNQRLQALRAEVNVTGEPLPVAATETKSQQQQQQQRPCADEQPSDEAATTGGDVSSVSALSPTLRLTNKPQRKQLTAASGGQQPQASAKSAPVGAKEIELDESLGRDNIAHAASTGGESLRAAQDGRKGAPATSGGGGGGGSLAAEQPILSLVDEFDSQISTNKTQGKFQWQRA